jgi:hypothetical protein
LKVLLTTFTLKIVIVIHKTIVIQSNIAHNAI